MEKPMTGSKTANIDHNPRHTTPSNPYIKGTILEHYSFDARDFTESQLNALELAGSLPFGNKELRLRLLSAVRSQRLLKEKFFRRVAEARREAYATTLRHKNASKVGVPSFVVDGYESVLSTVKNFFKSFLPTSVSIYTKDSMQWPKIQVDMEDLEKPHLLAGMPSECVELDGFERLKQAFFPKKYIKYFDPENPSHTFNRDKLIEWALLGGVAAGAFQAVGHAQKDLDSFKMDRGSHVHESRAAVFRARQHTWVQSFLKYGLRWGWRVSFLFSSMFVISQSMTIYRLEDKMSHYVIGAAIPAALYKWKLGPIGMVKAGFIGMLLIGMPVGFIFANMGYNLKKWYYFCNVEPRVTGPMTEEAMTPEQYFRSHELMLSILDLLNSEHCDELNNHKFYRQFIGGDQ